MKLRRLERITQKYTTRWPRAGTSGKSMSYST